MPDLCRLEICIFSKDISNTISGFNDRTGPNFSIVFFLIHLSSSLISIFVKPEYALANLINSLSFHNAKL